MKYFGTETEESQMKLEDRGVIPPSMDTAGGGGERLMKILVPLDNRDEVEGRGDGGGMYNRWSERQRNGTAMNVENRDDWLGERGRTDH